MKSKFHACDLCSTNFIVTGLEKGIAEPGLNSAVSGPHLLTVFFSVIAGQERPTDQDMGDGKGLDMARRSSVTSMESTVSSGTQTAVQDDPEQFEVIKQQKEIIEHGIEL